MNTERHYLDYLLVNVDNYKFATWQECFPDGNIKLDSLCINDDWNDFFAANKEILRDIEIKLAKLLAKNKNIVPYPELTFNTPNVLSPEKIKVVTLGQDPFINIEEFDGVDIPQAMGFSFSVPYGYPRPPSLNNIYKNLLRFKHVVNEPEEGCLVGWVMQGCFMINSAFTTFLKQSNAHKLVWPKFTKAMLNYINDNCENVVFLAWGANAHELCAQIDTKKHKIIYSSHPSPYSYSSTIKGNINGVPVIHPSFEETDHFGEANKYLVSHKKTPILWDIIDI